ncbi:polymeric immunoglobulin receptor-like [Pelodytes ibericus]
MARLSFCRQQQSMVKHGGDSLKVSDYISANRVGDLDRINESSELVGPEQVTGLVDGSVIIKCFYSTLTKANKHARKFFCRVDGRRKCTTIISTNNFVQDKFRDRVSLVDNKEDGFISVELSSLQLDDKGQYKCGIGLSNNGITAVVTLDVTKDSDIPEEVELIYGQLRSTVNYQCDFDEKFSRMKMYLCKLGKEGCTTVIDSTGNVAVDYQGRVILNTGNTVGSINVKLIQLRIEDAGLYACGFGNYGENGDFKRLDLRINEETDIPQGSRLLTTGINGSIAAKCNYDPTKHFTKKFWCKWKETSCKPLIQSDGFVQEEFEGRIVIHDNLTSGSMQVVMNQLTIIDEGWYWCVMTDGKHDYTSTVQVKITEGKSEGLTGNKKFYVPAGKPISIPCSYPCKYNSYEKYWCKWSNYGCDVVISQEENQNGLSVNCENRDLVLSIDAMDKTNEGWYWCGVKKSGRYAETLAVQLIVGEEETRSNSGDPNDRMIRVDSQENSISTSSERDTSNTILAVSLSVCAAVLLVLVILFTIKFMKRRNTELVSVGSYRTNISMTDLDNCSYIGKDNPAANDSLETSIGRNHEGPKTDKKASQEHLDYSSFLIHQDGSPNNDNTS